jgi:hypothetical protein
LHTLTMQVITMAKLQLQRAGAQGQISPLR